MLASEVVFRILEQIKSGNTSDDFSYSTDIIWNMVYTYRSKILRQEKSSGKWLSAMYLQDLGEVILHKSNKHDDCAINLNECSVLKTDPLPKAVDSNLNTMTTFVGDLEGNAFEKTTYSAAIYSSYSKYTGRKPKYYEIGDEIYIINPKTNLLKYINVIRVCEDPRAANSFKKCGNPSECYQDLDFEFPCSSTIIDMIVKLCVEEIRGSRILPPDTKNDSTDN